MATVTGRLLDFATFDMDALSPRIIFTPSGPAVSINRLLSGPPIIATPDPVGDFSVALATTDTMNPERWYTIAVEWLDSAGGYVGRDFIDWKLYVPAAGGNIADLIQYPASPGNIWFGPNPPSNPSLYTGWVDTDNGNFYEWE